jgi:hypothetical protein
MSVTTTTTTAPSRIVIKPGECAILPSNAIILSTFTFDDAPDVQSDDCPELALDIFSKLEIAQTYCARFADSERESFFTPNPIRPNYDSVIIQGMRVNGVQYPFSSAIAPNGLDIMTFYSLSNPLLVWQSVIDSTALKGAIKITKLESAPPSSLDNERGYQIRMELKTFPAIQKDFTFYGVGSSIISQQEGGVKIEFRVLNCDDVAVNQ